MQLIKKHVQRKNRDRRKILPFWSPDVDHNYSFIHLFLIGTLALVDMSSLEYFTREPVHLVLIWSPIAWHSAL